MTGFDETGARTTDVRVRWSFDYNGGHMSGEVIIDRTDWGMASPEDRTLLIRQEVGDAVLRSLDVDWTISNARLDDPNY